MLDDTYFAFDISTGSREDRGRGQDTLADIQKKMENLNR